MTEYAQIERPVEGIQIIDDVTAQFGVDTLEGRVGPLMQGASSRSQFFELPAGLYTYEHPHPTESIIYTVYGEWVLTTGGKRHVMKPRSLFWFGPGISAGYEVPFDAPALFSFSKANVAVTRKRWWTICRMKCNRTSCKNMRRDKHSGCTNCLRITPHTSLRVH